MEFQHITTDNIVATYEAALGIFSGLMQEMRELSKKKPDATLSKGKVTIINRVLEDLKSVMANEPEAKFLDLLDDQQLPQNSDAVLVMVQYERAIRKFPQRYREDVQTGTRPSGSPLYEEFWITEEFVRSWKNNY